MVRLRVLAAGELGPPAEPGRVLAVEVTDVMAGGGLTNTYRGQLDDHGRVAAPGQERGMSAQGQPRGARMGRAG